MPPKADPARLEGSLLDPSLTPAEARRRLAAWRDLPLAGALLMPSLLQELGRDDLPIRLVGAVGFPTGAHTLVNKRVELLEVARLGGDAAEVALTPHMVSEGHMGGLEQEMKALLETAPELEVRFAVAWGPLGQAARAKLLRLLRDFPPAALRASLGPFGPPLKAAEVKALRPLLPQKVLLKVPVEDPDDAAALLEAGADLVESARPDRAAGGTP